jgi:hypothetical protein
MAVTLEALTTEAALEETTRLGSSSSWQEPGRKHAGRNIGGGGPGGGREVSKSGQQGTHGPVVGSGPGSRDDLDRYYGY